MSERIYIKVTSDFDSTGFMQPRAIVWPDGRCFSIEDIRSFRPAGRDPLLDCYTVVIRGKERCLYFEHSSGPFSRSLGRWFVEA